MIIHKRKHTGEKPFTCKFPDCGKQFTNYSDYVKHQTKVHSDKVTRSLMRKIFNFVIIYVLNRKPIAVKSQDAQNPTRTRVHYASTSKLPMATLMHPAHQRTWLNKLRNNNSLFLRTSISLCFISLFFGVHVSAVLKCFELILN